MLHPAADISGNAKSSASANVCKGPPLPPWGVMIEWRQISASEAWAIMSPIKPARTNEDFPEPLRPSIGQKQCPWLPHASTVRAPPRAPGRARKRYSDGPPRRAPASEGRAFPDHFCRCDLKHDGRDVERTHQLPNMVQLKIALLPLEVTPDARIKVTSVCGRNGDDDTLACQTLGGKTFGGKLQFKSKIANPADGKIGVADSACGPEKHVVISGTASS